MGNIQFIGHLYRKKMLTEKIMHECIKKLLADVEQPKQEDLECLSKLMSTGGRQLDSNLNAKMYMDAYFERVHMLSKNQSLDSRIRFMLQASLLLCLQSACQLAHGSVVKSGHQLLAEHVMCMTQSHSLL